MTAEGFLKRKNRINGEETRGESGNKQFCWLVKTYWWRRHHYCTARNVNESSEYTFQNQHAERSAGGSITLSIQCSDELSNITHMKMVKMDGTGIKCLQKEETS